MELEQAKKALTDWAVNAGDHPAGGAACKVLDALAVAESGCRCQACGEHYREDVMPTRRDVERDSSGG